MCVCVPVPVCLRQREDDTIYQKSFESIKKTNVPQNEPTERVATYQHLGRRGRKRRGRDGTLIDGPCVEVASSSSLLLSLFLTRLAATQNPQETTLCLWQRDQKRERDRERQRTATGDCPWAIWASHNSCCARQRH